MNRLIHQLLLLLFLALISATSIFAQPKWVGMMNKSSANYFKAVKSFDRYWKKNFLPNEEEEDSNKEQEEDPRSFLVKLLQSKERAREKSNELILVYKKFKKWQLEMLPYVKSDGTIMSREERLEVWENQ